MRILILLLGVLFWQLAKVIEVFFLGLARSVPFVAVATIAGFGAGLDFAVMLFVLLILVYIAGGVRDIPDEPKRKNNQKTSE